MAPTAFSFWHSMEHPKVHSFRLKDTDEEFTLDLILTKYEADLPCKNITYISTNGNGDGASHSVMRKTE